MKIYAVQGSSYDGCEGWSNWIMEGTTTTDYNKACKMAKEHESIDLRTKVVVVTEE